MTTLPTAIKHRELLFSATPPDQALQARELLTGLDNLIVEYGSRPNSLLIVYSLLDYSLWGLEHGLISEGFTLDDTPLRLVNKKLIYYSENMEFHNLNLPFRSSKGREHEIFAMAYDNHPHGDHDDTPMELREYK